MEEKQNPSAPQKILGKLKENSESLFIKRIPKDTKKAFIDYANREFCGDYGMAIKWLVDGLASDKEAFMLQQIEDHENRLLSLEHPQETEKPEGMKMCDGTIKKVTK